MNTVPCLSDPVSRVHCFSRVWGFGANYGLLLPWGHGRTGLGSSWVVQPIPRKPGLVSYLASLVLLLLHLVGVVCVVSRWASNYRELSPGGDQPRW